MTLSPILTSRLRSFRLFSPILAGATLRDRVVAALGAAICLLATALLCARTPHPGLLVAPMGASAVLLFAVPASPLAQPWSIFGGNAVSAIVGVVVVHWLGHSALALATAVGAAILAMSLLRCLHPPGGAVAMTVVLGGPAISSAGFAFPFATVAVESIVLIIAGWLFHRVSGHSYPHRLKSSVILGDRPHHLHRQDISQALADVGEAFDVSEDDLEVLLERAEHYARLRSAPTQSGHPKARQA
jgi:CBS domain-containing membrane protein